MRLTKEIFLGSLFAGEFSDLLYRQIQQDVLLIPEEIYSKWPFYKPSFSAIPMTYFVEGKGSFCFFLFEEAQFKDLLAHIQISPEAFWTLFGTALNTPSLNQAGVRFSFDPGVKHVDTDYLLKQDEKCIIISYTLTVLSRELLLIQWIPRALVDSILRYHFPQITANTTVEENMIHIVNTINQKKSLSLLDYLKKLEGSELQKFVYILFGAGFNEANFSALFLGLPASIQEKIYKNVSRNLKEVLHPDNDLDVLAYRKALSIGDEILLKLVKEKKLEYCELELGERFEDDLLRITNQILFKHLDIDIWVDKLVAGEMADEFLSRMDKKVLSQALCDKPHLMSQLMGYMSKGAKSIFQEDADYFRKQNKQDQQIKAKIQMVKIIKESITYDLRQTYIDLLKKISLYDKSGKTMQFIFTSIPLEMLAKSFLGVCEKDLQSITSCLLTEDKAVFLRTLERFGVKEMDEIVEEHDKKDAIRYVISRLDDFLNRGKLVFLSHDMVLRQELHAMLGDLG